MLQTIETSRLRDAVLEIERARPEPVVIGNQGVIYRIKIDGQFLAAKTLPPESRIPFLHQRTLRQEFEAYQRLEGLSGFPVCHGLLDRRWLILDWVEGRPFRETDMSSDAAFFDQLLSTIEAMHERGVAHGDLKRKANLIVRDDSPVLLDLGAAMIKKSGVHPINHRLFNFMRQTDINAWVKLKNGGYSNLSSEDVARLKRSWLERGLSRFRSR